jgi:hypothetical protein
MQALKKTQFICPPRRYKALSLDLCMYVCVRVCVLCLLLSSFRKGPSFFSSLGPLPFSSRTVMRAVDLWAMLNTDRSGLQVEGRRRCE